MKNVFNFEKLAINIVSIIESAEANCKATDRASLANAAIEAVTKKRDISDRCMVSWYNNQLSIMRSML